MTIQSIFYLLQNLVSIIIVLAIIWNAKKIFRVSYCRRRNQRIEGIMEDIERQEHNIDRLAMDISGIKNEIKRLKKHKS